MLAPLGTFLVYSATPLDATALGIAVGLTYLVTLLCETALLARHLARQMGRTASASRPKPASDHGNALPGR
jgi:hypothetical protein